MFEDLKQITNEAANLTSDVRTVGRSTDAAKVTPAAATTPLPSSSTPPGTVDLLSLVDVERDAVKGQWEMVDGVLLSPAGVNQARLQLSHAVPEEYRLTVVAERRLYNRYPTLGLGLVVGQRQCYCLIDCEERGGGGLDQVDGKSWNKNPTFWRSKNLQDAAPSTIVCEVRRGRITVRVDERQVVDWRGDFSRLSLYPAWKVPDRAALSRRRLRVPVQQDRVGAAR